MALFLALRVVYSPAIRAPVPLHQAHITLSLWWTGCHDAVQDESHMTARSNLNHWTPDTTSSRQHPDTENQKSQTRYTRHRVLLTMEEVSANYYSLPRNYLCHNWSLPVPDIHINFHCSPRSLYTRKFLLICGGFCNVFWYIFEIWLFNYFFRSWKKTLQRVRFQCKKDTI